MWPPFYARLVLYEAARRGRPFMPVRCYMRRQDVAALLCQFGALLCGKMILPTGECRRYFMPVWCFMRRPPFYASLGLYEAARCRRYFRPVWCFIMRKDVAAPTPLCQFDALGGGKMWLPLFMPVWCLLCGNMSPLFWGSLVGYAARYSLSGMPHNVSIPYLFIVYNFT